MKITFIQSLRYKLMEIFHPWDFRKVVGCKNRENRSSCTDKDCTDNGTCASHNDDDNQTKTDTPHSCQTISESISGSISGSIPDSVPDSSSMVKSQSDSILSFDEQPSGQAEISELSSGEYPSTQDDTTIVGEYQCVNQERQLLLQRILIKVLIICVLALLTLLIAPKSRANDHQSMASLSVGALFPNGLDLTAEYERSTTYHNVWAVELNGYLRWRKCPDCCKVCTKSFWDYYRSYHIGMVYKPCVYRTRNQHGRLRLGVSVGYDHRKVLGGVLLGYEHTYCLRYGCEVFWRAKMDVQVLAKNWVRPGVSIGLRLPL